MTLQSYRQSYPTNEVNPTNIPIIQQKNVYDSVQTPATRAVIGKRKSSRKSSLLTRSIEHKRVSTAMADRYHRIRITNPMRDSLDICKELIIERPTTEMNCYLN